MSPDKNAKNASYVKGASQGLYTTLKNLEPNNEVAAFLYYGA